MVEDVESQLYLHRQYVRWCRRCERENIEALWGDSIEDREYYNKYQWTYNDVFNLKKLFGLEPYDEEENWNCKYSFKFI